MSFVKKVDGNDGRIHIYTEGIGVPIMNSIRRVLISDIVCFGFIGEGEEVSVNVQVNETKFNNEFIAHRIGLIPLHIDLKDISKFIENGLTAKLDFYNKNSQTVTITTNNIELYEGDRKLTEKEREKILPPFIYENKKYFIDIAHIDPNKRLTLTAEAHRKTGIFHAGFSMVAQCATYYDYDDTDTSKDPVEREMAYYRNEDGSPKTVILAFKVINGYSYGYIVDKAFDILISKLNVLIDAINNNDTEKLLYITAMSDMSYLFKFKNETHTTGNMLQSFIHKDYVLDKKNTLHNGKRCLYAGYQVPDPMYSVMETRITIEDTSDELIFRECLVKLIEELVGNLRDYQGKWRALNPGDYFDE